MKMDEMAILLRSAGVEENTVTFAINIYEMGFEHGSRAYKELTTAIENAKDVCEYVDKEKFDKAKEATQLFWKSMKYVEDMQ